MNKLLILQIRDISTLLTGKSAAKELFKGTILQINKIKDVEKTTVQSKISQSTFMLKIKLEGKEIQAQWTGRLENLPFVKGQVITFRLQVNPDGSYSLILLSGMVKKKSAKEQAELSPKITAKGDNYPYAKEVSDFFSRIIQADALRFTFPPGKDEEKDILQMLEKFPLVKANLSRNHDSGILPILLFLILKNDPAAEYWKHLQKFRSRFFRKMSSGAFQKKVYQGLAWVPLDEFLNKIGVNLDISLRDNSIAGQGKGLNWRSFINLGISRADQAKAVTGVKEHRWLEDAREQEMRMAWDYLPELNRELPLFFSWGEPNEDKFSNSNLCWLGNWRENFSIYWPGFHQGDLTLFLSKKSAGITFWFHNAMDYRQFWERVKSWLDFHPYWQKKGRIINGETLQMNFEALLKENPQAQYWG